MRKLFMILFTLATVFILTTGAYAAELSVETQTGELSVGDTFKVTVTYSDDMLDSVKGSLEYDDDVLKYISGGSSSGNSGTIKLDGYSDDAETIKFDIVFKALKSGTSEYRIETSECYNLNGEQLNSPSKALRVEIADVAEADDTKVEQDTDSDDDNPQITDEEDEDVGEIEPGEVSEADDQQNSNTKMLIAGVAITLVILVAVIAIVRFRRKK